jgi:hypothetical protein
MRALDPSNRAPSDQAVINRITAFSDCFPPESVQYLRACCKARFFYDCTKPIGLAVMNAQNRLWQAEIVSSDQQKEKDAMTATFDEILAAANEALDSTVAAYRAIHGERTSVEKARGATTRAWRAVREAAELVVSADRSNLKKTTFYGNDLRELIRVGIGLVEGSIDKAMERSDRLAKVLQEIEIVLQNIFRSLNIKAVSVGAIVYQIDGTK